MSDSRQLPLFQSEPQSEKDLNRYTPLRLSMPFFSAHLVQEGKTEHTVKAFMGDMRLLMEYVGEDIRLGDIRTKTLSAYLDWMENGRGVSCSRKTYARRVTTLKVFFKWLKQIDAIASDPAKSILQRSGEAPLSYALNHEEIHQVLVAARTFERRGETDTRPELLFRLLLDTGIKKSEAMRLTTQDIHRENPQAPYVHIHHTARNVYKERKVPLDPDWLGLYDSYRLQYGISDKVFTCTARNLEYVLSDLGDAADIPVKISFEVMRWTSAVKDSRDGIEEDDIREKLGLSRITWHETGRKIARLIEWQDGQQALHANNDD